MKERKVLSTVGRGCGVVFWLNDGMPRLQGGGGRWREVAWEVVLLGDSAAGKSSLAWRPQRLPGLDIVTTSIDMSRNRSFFGVDDGFGKEMPKNPTNPYEIHVICSLSHWLGL